MTLRATTFEVADNGEPRVWVVWAVSTDGSHQPMLVAICSSEERAERYRPAIAPNFNGARFHTEPAPVDHLFGEADLGSVAFRTAMREIRRKRSSG
jgi:hypothetical protein